MKKYILAILLFPTLHHASNPLLTRFNGANSMLIEATIKGGNFLTEQSAVIDYVAKIISAIEVHGANPNVRLPAAYLVFLEPKEYSLLALTVHHHGCWHPYHDPIITLARYVAEPKHFTEAIAVARELAEGHISCSKDYAELTPPKVLFWAFRWEYRRYNKLRQKHKRLSEACLRLADNLEALRKEKFPQ